MSASGVGALSTSVEAASPGVSVVVCSHNGARRLPVVLASLAGQSLPRERYEVIVVDDGSIDETAATARREGARVVRLATSRGAGAARNAGVSAARAPIVAFIDDDCEADPDWLANLLPPFDDPSVDGIGGRVVPGEGPGLVLRFLAARNPVRAVNADVLVSTNPLYRLWLYLRAALVGFPTPAAGGELYLAVTANAGVRRALVYELGGFDESGVAEDEDFWRRARLRPQGVRLQYEPSALVRHHFDPGLAGTLRRARRYGQVHALLSAKHPSVRPIIYPFPVLVGLLLVLGLVTRRPRMLLGTGLAPLVLYPRWIVDVGSEHSLVPLSYPYLELLQEGQHLIGQLEGVREGYTPSRSSHLSASPRT